MLSPESLHPTITDSIQIAPDEVYSELCRLNINKACDPDNITPFLLKAAADFICVPSLQVV